MLRGFLHIQQGQGLVEYGAILVLIMVVVVVVMTVLGAETSTIFSEINSGFN
jgi:Flp pilus assembly pilin Flp